MEKSQRESKTMIYDYADISVTEKKNWSKCKDKGEKETDHHYFSNGIVVDCNQAQNNLNFIKLNEGIKSFVLIFVGKYQKVR